MTNLLHCIKFDDNFLPDHVEAYAVHCIIYIMLFRFSIVRLKEIHRRFQFEELKIIHLAEKKLNRHNNDILSSLIL